MLFTLLVRDVLLQRSLPTAAEAATAALRQRVYREAISRVPPKATSLRSGDDQQRRTDEALLSAFLQGDASALEVFLTKHLAWMQRWALIHLAPDDADDAVQDAFMALLEKAAQIKLQGPLRAYLFGLLRIAVIRARRAHARRRGEPLEDESLEDGTLVEPSADPEVSLLTRSSHEELAEALRRACSLREQEVILFTLEGMNDRTIASALETTENNVRVTRHRAMSKLRQELGAPSAVGPARS